MEENAEKIEKIFKKKTEKNPKKNIVTVAETKIDKIKKHFSIKWMLIIAGGVLVLSSLGSSFYFYRQWKLSSGNPEESVQKEAEIIKKKIGKFMELPNNEEPTIATVKNVEKLKDQAFFSKAKNGDIALVYSQSGKAILYRPSEDKIIEVMTLAPLSGQVQAEGQAKMVADENSAIQPEVAGEDKAITEEQQPEPENILEKQENSSFFQANVAIYNGTSIKGLAGSLADKISPISGISIVEKTNAKKNYDKTIVVDLTGNNGAMIQKIIEVTGGEQGVLPEGELRPEADVLVIAGKQ